MFNSASQPLSRSTHSVKIMEQEALDRLKWLNLHDTVDGILKTVIKPCEIASLQLRVCLGSDVAVTGLDSCGGT